MTAPESTRFRMMIIIALMMAEFTSAFELTMIYTALKTFFVMFGDPQAVGWVVTSYLLVSAAAAAICGKLGDMFGRKRVLMIVLVGAMTGSLISASTSDLNFIIAGRAIQGLAGAILPLCFGIAREALPLNKVPYGVSAIGSTAVVSAGLGVLLGGIIVDRLEWFAIFYVSSAFAFISFCAVLIFVPNIKVTKSDRRIDVLGGLLFVPAIFGVLLAVSKGGSWGWASPITLSLLIGGICLLGIWVWHELRIDHPLINLRLLTNPQLALANLGMLFYGLGPVQAQLHLMLMQQPVWTGVGVGLTATMAGVYSLPGQLVAWIAAPVTGMFCKRFGGRGAMIAGSATLAFGWLITVIFPANLLMLVLSGPVMAFGTVIIYSAIPNVIVAASPSANTAESTGVTQVARSSAQAVGAQVIAIILATATVSNADHPGVFPAASAMMLALYFVLAASLAILACAILLPRRAPQSASLVDDKPLGAPQVSA